jgi:hypothetical protein
MDLEALIASGQMSMDALTAAMEGRQGYAGLQLTESAQDLDALSQQFESVYKSMMIQTGINTGILDTLNQAYATTMQPLLDELNVLLAQENLSAQDKKLALEKQALVVEKSNGIWSGIAGIFQGIGEMIPG